MKTCISLAFAAFFLAATATAQHVNIGIKGGLNIFNIHNNNDANFDSKAGFHLGLLGHIHLSKEWAFQPELLYSAQGAKFNTLSKLNLDYINLPLLIQYMFDNGFRIQAGPQIGLLINAKSKTGDTSIDTKSNFKKVDFGLGAGIGYVNPTSGFGVDARYIFGLSNINEGGTIKSTNVGFQLGVFYLFKHQ